MVEMRVALREALRQVELRPTASRERVKIKQVIMTPDRGARIAANVKKDVPAATGQVRCRPVRPPPTRRP